MSNGRRRSIAYGDAAVSCPNGRWGRRRARVTECFVVLRAEDLYSVLLTRGDEPVAPGAHGELSFTLKDRSHDVRWESRPNAVWRRGRVFLRCAQCSGRCTRLYLPKWDSWLACRRCWGLTYASRTLQNYKTSLWGRGAFAKMFGTTQREWAFDCTYRAREARLRRSRGRWRERRLLRV